MDKVKIALFVTGKNAITLIAITIVLLLGLFIYATSKKNQIKLIDYNSIEMMVDKDEYVFLYNGDVENYVKDYTKYLKREFNIVSYRVKLSENEIKAIETDDVTIDGEGYIVYVEGELTGFISSNLSNNDKDEYVKKYLYGYIPSSERYYQVLSTAEEYIKKFNSSEYTVAVFGYSGCTNCTLYMPIVNKVAREHRLNIYYFDEDTYNKREYQKIMDLDLTIPSECTQKGEETSFTKGFDSPLTIITKNGKLKGCIKGYVKEETLIKKLNEFKLIKE